MNYWRKTTPLRKQSIHSLLFNKQFLSDDEAIHIGGQKGGHVQVQRYGHKEKFWHENVLAFGCAAGNLEPLPGSSNDMLFKSIQTFLNLLPTKNNKAASAKEYNRIITESYQHLRDYHLCHYALLKKSHSSFWLDNRTSSLPEALAHRLNLFRDHGTIAPLENEIISTDMWVSLFIGLGYIPKNYNSRVDMMDENKLKQTLEKIGMVTAQTANKMPSHKNYINRYLQPK